MATVDAQLPPCRIPAIPFAFDYGGTLIKVAFYLPEDRAPESGQFSQVIHRPHIGCMFVDYKFLLPLLTFLRSYVAQYVLSMVIYVVRSSLHLSPKNALIS